MAIRLEKGENARLSMSDFHVGLGWDVQEGDATQDDFDLDVSAFLIGSNKKILRDEYFVFYNSENRLRVDASGELIKPLKVVHERDFSSNAEMRHKSRPTDPECAVIGSLDDEDGATSEDGDDETIDIALSKVNPDVQEIVITVSIHLWKERAQNFGQVERAYVRLYKPGQGDGEGEFIYDLSEDFSSCTAVEFCRLYRHNGEWKIQATGVGHKGGLQDLLQKYVY